MPLLMRFSLKLLYLSFQPRESKRSISLLSTR